MDEMVLMGRAAGAGSGTNAGSAGSNGLNGQAGLVIGILAN